jgi:ubiquinone/menaquinone biosynthesis C-methylase UbiE
MKNQHSWIDTAKSFYSNQVLAKSDLNRLSKFVRAYRKILKLVKIDERSKLLDVGCGCGELILSFQGVAGIICGIDISNESLKLAKYRNPSAYFFVADAASIPFRENFDFVTAISSLEFCENKRKVLEEIYRVLNRNGKLYLEVRNRDFLIFKHLNWLLPFLEHVGMLKPYPLKGFRDLNVEEWQQVIENSGFRITTIKKSLRPIFYGDIITRLKNAIIKIISVFMPLQDQYMIGFICEVKKA